MEDIPANAKLLEPIMQEIMKREITLHEDEVREVNQYLNEVLLEKMVEQMKKEDPTFQALYKERQYGGSYYENLRVGHPDEFDINLELELPMKPENIQIDIKNTCPGFAKIKVETKFNQNTSDAVKKKVESWLKDGFLSRDKFIQWFQGVVDKSLKSIVWPSGVKVVRSTSGPAITLNATIAANGKTYKFDVDLVPVFRFNKDKWPSRPIRQPNNIPGKSDSSSMLLRDKQGWDAISSYYIKTLFLWELEKNKQCIEEFWRKPRGELFMHMLNVLEYSLQHCTIKFFWHEKSNLIDHLNKSHVENMAGRVKSLKKQICRALADQQNLWAVMEKVFKTPSAVKQGRSQSPLLQESSDGGSSMPNSSLYGSLEPQETLAKLVL